MADALQQETADVLSRLIRFDTVNPPGNERACQEWLRDYLTDAGLECELDGTEPERPNLVALLPLLGVWIAVSAPRTTHRAVRVVVFLAAGGGGVGHRRHRAVRARETCLQACSRPGPAEASRMPRCAARLRVPRAT